MPNLTKLLSCVQGYEPSTVDQIYRRYAGLTEWKSLTTAHRRERRQIAATLERAYQLGLVHREVVPENDVVRVKFSTDGTPK